MALLDEFNDPKTKEHISQIINGFIFFGKVEA